MQKLGNLEGGQKFAEELTRLKEEKDAAREEERKRRRRPGDAWNSAHARLKKLQKDNLLLQGEAKALTTRISWNTQQRKEAHIALQNAEDQLK